MLMLTERTDLDTSSLEDRAYAVRHREQGASLGRQERQILSCQLQRNDENSITKAFFFFIQKSAV